MESYITHREEHTSDKPFYTLKEDLIIMAKRQAFELGANAIIEAKLSITKGNHYINRYYLQLYYLLYLEMFP